MKAKPQVKYFPYLQYYGTEQIESDEDMDIGESHETLMENRLEESAQAFACVKNHTGTLLHKEDHHAGERFQEVLFQGKDSVAAVVEKGNQSRCEAQSESNTHDGAAILEEENHAMNEAQFEKEKKGNKRIRDESKWIRNIRKRARVRGEEYISEEGKWFPKKEPLAVKCNCRYKCREFSEEARLTVCKEYYGIGDRVGQKDFITSHIQIVPVKRRRVRVRQHEHKKIRVNSYIYTLPLKREDKVPEMVRVCQHFFCKTLVISSEMVRNVMKNVDAAGHYVCRDRRKGRTPKNKLDEGRKNIVRDHIKSLPRIEAHFRQYSNKQDVSPELNVVQMYRSYVKLCCEKDWSLLKSLCTATFLSQNLNLRVSPRNFTPMTGMRQS
ncbi:uncharacterized protein [Amphiura filiformis]|uniref:uncharacterized protein n=1 Tax=Amphiura filiformis TaxID=82378 RepID=UPI003B2169BC